MAVERKAIEFLGSSLEDLLRFPVSARREAGYQLDKVQAGEEPDDWKPMGVVYVLHCFQKKAQRTDDSDIALGKARYRALMKREGTK